MSVKKYCFDIDGTICTNTFGDYKNAQPYPERINMVNKLYDEGHKIILFTARGTTTKIDWRPVTEGQMEKWGLKYHELLFGKPEADIFVDDRAVNDKDWFKS